jgi:hypothetical protein
MCVAEFLSCQWHRNMIAGAKTSTILIRDRVHVWAPHNGFPSYPKQKKRLPNWHELYNEVNHSEDILNISLMSYIVLISNQHTDEPNFYAIHRREIQTSRNSKRLCELV